MIIPVCNPLTLIKLLHNKLFSTNFTSGSMPTVSMWCLCKAYSPPVV